MVIPGYERCPETLGLCVGLAIVEFERPLSLESFLPRKLNKGLDSDLAVAFRDFIESVLGNIFIDNEESDLGKPGAIFPESVGCLICKPPVTSESSGIGSCFEI